MSVTIVPAPLIAKILLIINVPVWNRRQALEGELKAMNNMGVCYAQGIGVVENHATTQGFEYSKQWLLHHLTDKGMDKNSSGILY